MTWYMATSIYIKNGEMKQQQPAHMDYLNEVIFFSPETSRMGSNRTLRELTAFLGLASFQSQRMEGTYLCGMTLVVIR